MPNHVMNVLTLWGEAEQIRELLDTIKDDRWGAGSVDFNKIIPMPSSLNIEAGSRTHRGLKAYREFVEVFTLGGTINMDKLSEIPLQSEAAFLRQRTDISGDKWELGRAAWNNLRLYGAPTWYEWCIQHWGTKWNAYGLDDGGSFDTEDNLRFQTAWSAPPPILRQLTEQFPNIEIEHQWADEDLGSNCGQRVYRSGVCIEEYYPEGNIAGVRFAAELWERDLEEEGIVLNKSSTDFVNLNWPEFEAIEICGKDALFTNDRLTDEDIPAGLYCYHLRHSDSGDRFCTMEPRVGVNHGGSVILKEALDFGKKGYIALTEDTDPNFFGEQMNFRAFIEQGQNEDLSLGGMKF